MKWKELHKNIEGVLKFIFGIWLFIFATLIVGSILKEFDLIPSAWLSSKGLTLDNLNNIGGTLNIITSLTGVATLYLLSLAIKTQKEELEAVNTGMENQYEEMQKQTQQSQNNAITDRTFTEIDKWKAMRLEILNKKNLEELPYSEKVDVMAHYFDWLVLIHDTNLKDTINLPLLLQTIHQDIQMNEVIYEMEKHLARQLEQYDYNKDFEGHLNEYKSMKATGYGYEDYIHTPSEVLSYINDQRLTDSFDKGVRLIETGNPYLKAPTTKWEQGTDDLDLDFTK